MRSALPIAWGERSHDRPRIRRLPANRMTNVYSAQDVLLLGHLRNLLVREGIACEVRTPYLAAAIGDVPFTECWSQLWVVNDEDFECALKIISGARETAARPRERWTCRTCGETMERQFEGCWRCGSVPASRE